MLLSTCFFASFKDIDSKIERIFLQTLVILLQTCKIASLQPISNTNVSRRTFVIAQEALKRGFSIKVVKIFSLYTNILELQSRKKSYFFIGLPTETIEQKNVINLDDKYQLKKFLELHKLPFVQGKTFFSKRKAIQYVNKNDKFPLVIKPRFGSLSKQVTTKIQNNKELEIAIKLLKKNYLRFIVEKHVEGNVYRATVVGNKMVACAHREPPNIIGDGIHTIQELLEKKK
jgi:cyanophycin synthetase